MIPFTASILTCSGANMDYGNFATTARRLITGFGKTVPADRTAPVQRINGVESRPVPVSFSVTGVLTSWKAYEVGASLIQSGDMKFIATSDEVIKIGDVLTIAGQKWRVEQPNPVAPDTETVIVYKLQIRRL